MFVHICVMNISVQSRSFSNEVVVFLELSLSLSLYTVVCARLDINCVIEIQVYNGT
jgi:hypothetical protein